MRTSPDSATGCSAPRLLLRLLPRGFRDRFGEELLSQIHMDRERARARGGLALSLFTLRTFADLLKTAVVERWDPTYVASREGRASVGVLEELRIDVTHALRGLRRAPGFSVMTVVTLGLALGALAGIYTVVDAVILRPLPFTDPDRIVFIVGSAPGEREGEIGVSPEMYLQYKDAKLVEHVSVQGYGGNRTLRVDDQAERIPTWFPTPDLFAALGVEPLLGRLPAAADDGKVVLLSHRLWTRMFDGDPGVIGRTVEADGVLRTVIAVMKPDFWWLNDGHLLWVPIDITPATIEEPGQFELRLVARMAHGATTEQIAEELTGLARGLPERFGASPEYARVIEKHRAVVRPIAANLPVRSARALWTLFGSALIVLLIACANVTCLFLVRAERRQHDHAVRRALGGTRTRLVRIALAESLILAVLAGAVGVLLSQVRLPFLMDAAGVFDRIAPIQPLRTILFTLGAAVLAGLLCGLVPALRASSPRLAALREAGRSRTRRHHWTQSSLVTAQTALALVMLIGSTLLARSFWTLNGIELGYDTSDLMTFQVAPDFLRNLRVGETADLTGPAYARFHLDLMDRIAALPGVESVGLVNNVPLDEAVSDLRVFPDGDAPRADGGIQLYSTFAAGAYFESMRVTLVEGRTFTREENTANPGSVVISRSVVDLLWPGQTHSTALGRRIRRDGSDEWHTVVGIVGDVRYDPLEPPPPIVYFPLSGTTPASWRVTSPGYVVKTTRAAAIVPEIRDLIRQAAPGAPMYQISTMDDLVARDFRTVRLMMLLVGFGAALSLILSAIGLFGVLSYVVAERTREIGVRIALGANVHRVQRMVIRQGSLVVALGVCIGLGVAAYSTRVLQGLLFGVQPIDVISFAGMAGLMLLIGWLASWLPARRASRVDPIEALRGG
jgi:putative ABC transport system permease protein